MANAEPSGSAPIVLDNSLGSLFTIAYEYGYVKDKRHLFTSVNNSVDNSVDNSVEFYSTPKT
jgi:hypothetical protein